MIAYLDAYTTSLEELFHLRKFFCDQKQFTKHTVEDLSHPKICDKILVPFVDSRYRPRKSLLAPQLLEVTRKLKSIY